MGIGLVADGHLPWTDRIVADYLGTGVADHHLLFEGRDFDVRAPGALVHATPVSCRLSSVG